MRILLVGNSPYEIGGVANYTRPLAVKLSELGHDIFYFYSGAWFKRYDWRMKPYLRVTRNDFPFECAEVMNSPQWFYNFGNPLLDVGTPDSESLFLRYIEKVQPDVLHLHSRFGLPASIIEIAARNGIKVFTTIHVYGFLCQKRVMIDDEGNPCAGPSDLAKCGRCTGTIDIRKMKFNARIENTSKILLDLLVHAKRFLKGAGKAAADKADQGTSYVSDTKIAENLRKRLEYMSSAMNEHAITNICVSEDVKHTLMKYGVREEKLLVQHIGSLIAEKQQRSERKYHSPLVIGNIGGVGHYKGTHVLVDAVSRMKSANFTVKIFGKYEERYRQEIMKGREHLPIEFLGRYVPDDLPGILQQIDLMVLPSICNDTAPQTIFESYSRYVPIVASDIGGFPDFVRDGINGRLFRPGDSDDLAAKLDEVLADPQQIEGFRSNIPKLKTITENAEELLSLYRESVQRSY